MVADVQKNQKIRQSTPKIFIYLFFKWHTIWVQTHFVHAKSQMKMIIPIEGDEISLYICFTDVFNLVVMEIDHNIHV